jgi:hypothetical protein
MGLTNGASFAIGRRFRRAAVRVGSFLSATDFIIGLSHIR